jgi:hypothetical protein
MAGFLPATHKTIQNGIRLKVINRTRRQYKDYANNRFIAYSMAYAKFKGVTPDKVSLFLTGKMLEDFYVEVKPLYYNLSVKGLDIPFDSITIEYGFKSNASINKYFWNANNRHGKNRDFLGLAKDEWLMPEAELKQLVLETIEQGY